MKIDFSTKDVFKTGVQESGYFHDSIDFAYNFVMVYGFKELEERVSSFKNKGYNIQFMTGIAWGEYQDYLLGEYDGRNHWDEAQMDKDGEYILHGPLVPYMVPTINFCNYLIEKLKKVVDLGITRIHLEEPEFWQHAGYSKAFKFEFANYYKKTWQDQQTNLQAFYETSKLKAFLYARAIDYIASAIKTYGMSKYQKYIYIYVPTHSLLNYAQWKIISPEGLLTQINSIDGYIAQVWTGTSREQNTYQGKVKERTFETAFLEYGIMQTLIYNSDQMMWFLNDPIEDNPSYTWEDYQYHYEKTLIASLLHSSIYHYEVAPWPLRIFNRKIPITNDPKVQKRYIPESYDRLLSQVFQILQDIPKDEPKYIDQEFSIGMVLSDTAMYERDLPNHLKDEIDEELTSLRFPKYYGLSLPLIYMGLPLLGASMERITEKGYLNQFDCIVLSYDFQKPDNPTIHDHLYRYMLKGGLIIFVGDSQDKYQTIQAWWNQTYENLKPIDHLLNLIDHKKGTLHTKVGLGQFSYLEIATHKIASTPKIKQIYDQFITESLDKAKLKFKSKSFIGLERGNYLILAGLEEANNYQSYERKGLFVDMLDINLPIIQRISLEKDTYKVYYDIEKAKDRTFIAISYKHEMIETLENKMVYKLSGKTNLQTFAKYKSLKKPINIYKSNKEVHFEYDKMTKTIHINLKLEHRNEILEIVYQ